MIVADRCNARLAPLSGQLAQRSAERRPTVGPHRQPDAPKRWQRDAEEMGRSPADQANRGNAPHRLADMAGKRRRIGDHGHRPQAKHGQQHLIERYRHRLQHQHRIARADACPAKPTGQPGNGVVEFGERNDASVVAAPLHQRRRVGAFGDMPGEKLDNVHASLLAQTA